MTRKPAELSPPLKQRFGLMLREPSMITAGDLITGLPFNPS